MSNELPDADLRELWMQDTPLSPLLQVTFRGDFRPQQWGDWVTTAVLACRWASRAYRARGGCPTTVEILDACAEMAACSDERYTELATENPAVIAESFDGWTGESLYDSGGPPWIDRDAKIALAMSEVSRVHRDGDPLARFCTGGEGVFREAVVAAQCVTEFRSGVELQHMAPGYPGLALDAAGDALVAMSVATQDELVDEFFDEFGCAGNLDVRTTAVVLAAGWTGTLRELMEVAASATASSSPGSQIPVPSETGTNGLWWRDWWLAHKPEPVLDGDEPF